METTFETSHYDPSDEVIFAAIQLKEGGKDWWDVQRNDKG